MFEGRQESINRRVAVKILPKETTFSGEQIERFQREAEAAGRLNHPNIVAVYGIDEFTGHHLITQEYVEGGDLESALDKHSGSATDADRCRWVAGMTKQIAEGLHHAHTHGVIHRDMKPGNILLTGGGAPKITDFGLARVDDQLGLSQTGAVMGTPHYMSPEQVNALPSKIDARTDVYGLGALLYRMLTHKVPFEANSMQGIFLDILTRLPKSPQKHQPGIHPDLDAVCLKALEKLPEDRYQTCGAFAEDLERYLTGQPTMARPVGLVGQWARSMQRLATSTLSMVTLLIPTAWVAIDRLGIRPPALEDADLHWVRLGLAVVTMLALAWPLSVLGVRLARAQRWGLAPAWALALLLGAGASLHILEERTAQIHVAQRVALMAQIELEAVGDRRSVDDLMNYEQTWADRIGPDDMWMLARGYLKRQRATEARDWSVRMADTESNSAVYYSMLAAIHTALGEVDEVAQADKLLQEHARFLDDWQEWRTIGDIQRDAQRFDIALNAYLQAQQQEDVNRDQLNIRLAQISVDLCQWDHAEDYLDDYIKWKPDDPQANRLAYIIAMSEMRVNEAETFLDTYFANEDVFVETRLGLRASHLRHLGFDDEVWPFIEEIYGTLGDNPDVSEWAASVYAEDGNEMAVLYGEYRRLGYADVPQAVEIVDVARKRLASARDIYERLTAEESSALAEIGLSAIHISLANLETDEDEATALRARAVTHAERAVELDPTYFHGHYNLGIARYRQALADADATDVTGLNLEQVRGYLDPYRRSLELNGLQAVLLNDTADALKHVFALTGDKAALDEAYGYLRRAIVQATPSAGVCQLDSLTRMRLSVFHTTMRECLELADDDEQALEHAKLALEVVKVSDPSLDDLRRRRTEAVERLEAKVGN